jgi:integral membrane protein
MSEALLGRFRLVALTEGVSFLVLLGVAMPLKYLAGMPMAVKVVGWAHGVLFMAFLFLLAQVALDRRWPLVRVALAFLSSVVPFGTFWFDRSLRAELEALRASA